MISIISATMRRSNGFKFFVVLIFTFTGYWFGRRSCNYTILESSLYVRKGKIQNYIALNEAKFKDA